MSELSQEKPQTATKYDLNTYWGRVRHFADVTDVRTLFTTSKQLEAAQTLLEQYETGKIHLGVDVTIDKIWAAKKTKDSMVHPDTGKVIPAPFRFSAFVPANLGIVVGMLTARSIPSIVLWQTVNQTYNVCVNYANRNASSTMDNKQLGISFTGALVSSVGTAVGLNEWVKRTTAIKDPFMKQRLQALVPFVAVAVANVFNITLMRITELKSGVDVKTEDGQVIGKSVIAGQMAIGQTIFSRILLITPSMVVPPVVMNYLEFKTSLFKNMPWLRTPTYVGLLTVFIGAFLPLCIGLFPQQSKIAVDKLEPKFATLAGNHKHLYYNKGL